MAQYRARINLSARVFPLVSKNWGHTIIVPQYDQNFNRQVQSQEDLDHDVGIPQAYFMQNVMPAAQGFQSVSYQNAISPPGGVTDIQYCLDIVDDANNYAMLAVCASGNWWAYQPSTGAWYHVRASGLLPGVQVYTAYCDGLTYIWQKGNGASVYNFSTHTISSVTFGGLNVNNINGIIESFGYLIAWSDPIPTFTLQCLTTAGSTTVQLWPAGGPFPLGSMIAGVKIVGPGIPAGSYTTSGNDVFGNFTISNAATATSASVNLTFGPIGGAVYWSSTIDCTDFVPSLITGAGSGAIQGLKGNISLCVPHTRGFMVYSTENIVAAQYSGNPRYPFDFLPITGSGGMINRFQVSPDADNLMHMAYTTAGLENISMTVSQPMYPEITDFLSGRLMEDFNTSTDTFTYTTLSTPMVKKLAFIANRYLVLSYGASSLTHAIVVDTLLKRWGKLKVNHVHCFEIDPSVVSNREPARTSMGFLQNDGTVVFACTEYQFPADAALILGKFQFVRARRLILEEVKIERVPSAVNFSLTIWAANDGRTIQEITPYQKAITADELATFTSRAEGENISLLLKGQFTLVSGILTFSLGGKR